MFRSPKVRWFLFAVVLVAVLASLSSCGRKTVSPPAAPPAATNNRPGGGGATGDGGGSGGGSGSGAASEVAADVEPVFFGYDSHSLDESARATLERNARVLRARPETKITIEGHCDERGTAEYNMALGELRAQAASRWLVGAGVAPERISTISYGKERPFDEGHTESAWSRNRRAHLVVR
ncbi:MAG: peptidoglycan-associated lipoprotein Pal [Candidatus Eisenbacteria bacterium]